MSAIINKTKRAARKAVAGYATFKTVKGVATTLAERLCHVLEIDLEYTESDFDDAVEALLQQHAVRLPGSAGDKVRPHDLAKPGEERFAAKDWTWMPVPGVSRLLQARTAPSGDGYEVRAAKREALEALHARLLADTEDIRANRPAPEFNPQQYRRRTDIFSWDGDNWQGRRSKVSRSFESVVLPVDLQQEIEEDIRTFTESRERLQRLELAWRRGYLLEGPPGTGKTSVSLAIAAALRFNLASLALTDVKSDAVFRKAVSELPQNSVLVIEDIDAYSVSHDREHNANRDGALSLSGLLNGLDGFETPDGLVVIVTTNHVEALDAALIRKGRLDRQFHLGYIQASELERLFTWFYEDEAPTPAPEQTGAAKLAPADVAEKFKQHLDDPLAGWQSVLDLIPTPTQLSAVA